MHRRGWVDPQRGGDVRELQSRARQRRRAPPLGARGLGTSEAARRRPRLAELSVANLCGRRQVCSSVVTSFFFCFSHGFRHCNQVISNSKFVSNYCSLDNEMWSIEIHFEDNQHMDRKIGKCDITYLNLLSLIESKGYCYRDSMYCLVEGVPGYELVDGMGKVLQMVKKCEHKQAMSLVVMQGQNKPSFSMLSAFAAAHSFALDDDDDEVMYLGS